MWLPTRPLVAVRGLSSVGRALPLQGRSQGFESPRLHKTKAQFRHYPAVFREYKPITTPLSQSPGPNRSATNAGRLTVVPFPFFGEPTTNTPSTKVTDREIRTRMRGQNG